MTRAHRILTLTTAGALLPVAALAGPPGPAAQARTSQGTAQCPWLNTSLPVAVRVGDMLGLASTTSGYENATSAVPSLCIPGLVLQDGPAGITAGPAGSHTQLPAPIDVGASFDPSLAYEYGQVQGGEAAAKGVDAVQGPDVNLARVPQGGRNDEGYGEDPHLSGQLGTADAKGIQSQGEMAVLKHFDDYNQAGPSPSPPR